MCGNRQRPFVAIENNLAASGPDNLWHPHTHILYIHTNTRQFSISVIETHFTWDRLILH